MILNDCSRAEVLAGAVALGEASDAQREAYRRHLSGCRDCIASLGGERDIERTMAVVAQARETESWEPDLRAALRDRARATRRGWRVAFSSLATAAVVAIGAYALVSGNAHGDRGRQVALERRVPAQAHASRAVTAAGHDLVVVHNVVTLKRPRLVAAAPGPARHHAPVRANAPAAASRSVAAGPAAVVAEVSPSQRDKRSVAALRTVETAPPAAQRAESIAVMPAPAVIHEVVPLGGDGAIVPRPPSIAYYENAEGTTAFDVSVDERGLPVKCTITKGSGYLVLDEAVCRAAMSARYLPRTVNGRAVASLYHDAFTFRTGNER